MNMAEQGLRAAGAPPLPYRTGADGKAMFPPRLLTDLIDTAIAYWPQRTALDFFGRTWTYAELGALVRRAARGLQDLGVKPGDRVGLALANTPYQVVLYFAVLRIGGVVVNVNPLYTTYELTTLIRDSGLKVIAVPEARRVHEKIEAAARETGLEAIIVGRMKDILTPLKSLSFRLFRRADHLRISLPELHRELAGLLTSDAAPEPVELQPDDVAVLQYTGGTTGTPKGAMLTHANLAANSAQMLHHFGGYPDEQQRTLGVLPMFHVFALTCVLNYSVESGAEIVLLPTFEMDQVLAAIRRKPPSQVFGVPTIYAAFNALPDARVPRFERARCCVSGGAPLPLEVRETFERRTGARVVEGYGLTEASPIITCNPLFGVVKENSCGPRFPGTVIEIRDPEAPGKLLATGERGEVMAAGPQVMKGYWNNPDATSATFWQDRLRTGDIGYLDEDGYLFLVDRIKDIILCSGYNVYPRNIEDAAYHHPEVHEAIAIGIPDDYRGQSPKLFVTRVPGSELTAEALETSLAERLSRIEMPTEIEFRDALPKTMIGKLSKKELVEEEAAKRKARG